MGSGIRVPVILTVAISLLGALAADSPAAALFAASGLPPTSDRYAIGSTAFAQLVADSYDETGSRSQAFDRWLDAAYAGSAAKLTGNEDLPLPRALAERRRQLQVTATPAERARLERDTGAWLHRLVRSVIPNFSLDRGFEFAYAVRYGERQCLLQSTLIAGLLQAMDVDAGVDMVWKSSRAAVSNNGHAVAVIKLADGRDLLVDASDRAPFVRHQGLFAAYPAGRSYQFVEPVYTADAAIVGYRPVGGGRALAPRDLRPLDLKFVRSQFYFYRGERAPGGLLGAPRTARGLAASARFLERAEQENPQNPLAIYVLGHVYLRQGRAAAARAQYAKGYVLYQQFGYVPDGPKAAYLQTAR
jgi:hypothetical protein